MGLFIYLASIRTIDRRGWNWCWMERRADRKEQCSGRPYLDAAGCCDGKWNVRRGRGSRCVCNTQTQVHIWVSANQHMAKLVRLMMPIFTFLLSAFYLLHSSCFSVYTRERKSDLDKLEKSWYENHSNVVLKVYWISKKTGLKPVSFLSIFSKLLTNL